MNIHLPAICCSPGVQGFDFSWVYMLNLLYPLVMTIIAGWKIPTINGGFWLGNSSISMGHGFHGELLNNQRVSIKNPQSLRQSFCIPENPYHEINQIITPNSEFFVGCWSKYPKSPKKKR
jgi:hypothetical protein